MAASPTAFPSEYSPASAAEHLLGLEGVDGQDVAHLDPLRRLIGQLGHHVADVLEHPPDVGAGLALDLDQGRHRGHALHDRLGALLHLDLGLALLAGERDGAGGDAPLLDVSLRRLDHHRAARAGEGARHRDDAPGLFRVEVEEGGDVVGVRQLVDGLARQRHLDRGGHAERDTVDVAHLVDDRDGLVQPVVDEHAVVLLHDGPGDMEVPGRGLVQLPGRVAELHRSRYDHDPRTVGRRPEEAVERDGGASPQPDPSGCARVVPDHRRLGDDHLGDRLHRHVADDRGRLVEQHQIEIASRHADPSQGQVEPFDDPDGVAAGAFDAHGPDHRARDDLDRAASREPP